MQKLGQKLMKKHLVILTNKKIKDLKNRNTKDKEIRQAVNSNKKREYKNGYKEFST